MSQSDRQAGGNNQAAANPLRSVHTRNFPDILGQLGISLAISTYQAGRVILIRNDAGKLNTHFRNFHKPMGISLHQNELAIGGANTVWFYRNVPAVSPKVPPEGKHDACFLPRRVHVTGNIDIHEMAHDANGQLWVVNTRFGALCTLDPDHSFNPVWRPQFVTALAAEDRCHLNGLCMVEGQARFATALGQTDSAGGWRENKINGGILIDIPADEVIVQGLSMPHSPRWFNNQLWVLESGEGSLARVDPASGQWQTISTLPGFTRGLAFIGPLAFIGLSQVRESAVFSGFPLVERLAEQERQCGVWVVNWQTGETLAFLRFEDGVQEIFAVEILPARFPDMLEWQDPLLMTSYVVPDAALGDVSR